MKSSPPLNQCVLKHCYVGPTVDGRNPAPPKRCWRDDSPVYIKTNSGFSTFDRGFQLVRNGLVHPQ